MDKKQADAIQNEVPKSKMHMQQLLGSLQYAQGEAMRNGIAHDSLSRMVQRAAAPANADKVPGLPVLSWTTNVNGEAVAISTDLALVEVKYLEHVINPLCNAHAAALRQNLATIEEIIAELKGRL